MMAEQTDVLAKPLPKPVAPTGKGRVGFKEAMGISEPFMTRKAEIQPQITQAEGDIAKAQQEQKEIKATGELSAQKRFGQEQETAMQGYQEKLEQEPLPAFIPSKDTAQDIAGLFSVISVISMLVGGGGKMSGQLALGNMNGMMEGYRKGRDDLYKKERTEFDKNFNAMIKKHAEFRQEMEDAVKLAATNKEEGFRAADLAATKAGSDIVKAQLRKGDLLGAYNLVSESQKGAEHALQMEQKARAEEAAEKFRRDQARLAAEARVEAAREKAAGKTEKITQQTMMAQRAVNSLGGVASALESMKELPAGTTTGILPNLQTKDGLLNYVRNNVGRKISSREAEILNTLFTGIGRNLASIEASGAATGLAELSKQMQNGVYINAGVDDPYKVAIKLADIRRIATENIRPAIESGLMPKQQAEVAAKLVERIEKAIPYSTVDVVKAATQGKTTLGEKAEEAVRPSKTYATEAEADAAFKAGTLKSGEKVIIGGQRGTWE